MLNILIAVLRRLLERLTVEVLRAFLKLLKELIAGYWRVLQEWLDEYFE